MQLRTAIVTMGAGVAILASAALAPIPVSANPSVSIRILFDFGDGSYIWASETIEDSVATNATWSAVQHAAAANHIRIDSGWFSCCGTAIFDLGGRHPPAGFVGLLEWKSASHSWEFTATGVSTLVLDDGDTIALSNAAFASVPPYAGRTPVPTPEHPSPSMEFRGDWMNSGMAASAAPRQIGVLWDRNTEYREIGATPAVGYGNVFVPTMRAMFAMDARNGETRWTSVRAKGFSSPALFNDSVYIGTSDGTVVRFNATTGAVLWETRLLAITGFSGITSSPKIVYDRIFIGTFNESGGPGEVVALWEGNGTVAWRRAAGSIHYSSPAFSDGTIYVGVMGLYNTTSQVSFERPYGVLALHAATGEEQWFFPTGGPVAASPAIVGPNLVVPAKDGNVYALNRTTGALEWQTASNAGISSPATFGDTVFVGTGSFGAPGGVVALDAVSGSVKWTFVANGPVQSSVTYAEGILVFATNTARGTVYAVNATTGRLEWSFEPLPSEYILGSPVVADGVVFAPSDNGHVYALGASMPAPLPVLAAAGLGLFGTGLAIAAWIILRRRPRDGS